jgi:hypothetical protein
MAQPQLDAALGIDMSTPITNRLMTTLPNEKLAPISPRDMAASLQERRSVEAGLRGQVLQSESDILKAEQAQKIAGLESKQANLQKEATELAGMPERQTLKQTQESLKDAAFIPTKDNAQDIATIFSLMGIVGMAIGGGGKDNAYAAMAGMNGMLEGYKRGRADIYKRERDMFDKNFKALQTKVQIARDELADAVMLKTKNFEAGRVAEEVAIAKTGSSVLEATLKKQGSLQALKTLDGMFADLGTLDKKTNDLYKEEQKNTLDKERLNIDRARLGLERQRVDIERQKAMSADEKRKAAVDKMPKEDRAAYQLRETLIPQLEKALPVLDRINKQGKWTNMTIALGLDPRVAENEFRNDPEALDLIRTFALFRSKEFETAGKALTRVENKILAPLYQSEFRVYEGIRNAMNSGLEEMKRQKGFIENQYPSLKARQEGAVSASEQPAASNATQRPSFASEAEANAAFESGAIRDGTPISVGGRNAIYRAR